MISVKKPAVRFALLVIAVCLLAGCKSREIGSSASSSPASPAAQTQVEADSGVGLTGGKLVFEDDFGREELGERWKRGSGEGGSGQWRIEEARVAGNAIRNDPLWLQSALPDKVRVEFEAQALTNVGDLKIEIFGDGERHESGYILIFGGWNNKLDVIARQDEHGQDRKARNSVGVKPLHVYKMAVVRTDSTLHWYVDGEHFMRYEDQAPLVGEGHRHFAFANWDAPVRFGKVRVFDLGGL
ncbi:MAG: hypothetical protein H0U74_09835 [Bradymonadaceae bacterium]|nr:hypothetical protein [Lujinxingiaceae bacterium]